MASGFSCFRSGPPMASIRYPIGYPGPDVTLVREGKPSVHRRSELVRDEVTTIPCRRRGDRFSGESWTRLFVHDALASPGAGSASSVVAKCWFSSQGAVWPGGSEGLEDCSPCHGAGVLTTLLLLVRFGRLTVDSRDAHNQANAGVCGASDARCWPGRQRSCRSRRASTNAGRAGVAAACSHAVSDRLGLGERACQAA